MALQNYLSDKTDLAQSLLYGRTVPERKAHEDRIRGLIQTLGDRIGDKTIVAPSHDRKIRELKLLQLDSAMVAPVR
jgi:hypothetical protein